MGNKYLTNLAAVVRGAGLNVVEVSGWQTRARGSGGYDGNRPWAIMWHHTASDTSPENDVNYIVSGSDDAPLANLYLARDGSVWVCAGGATNTNGKGSATAMSLGIVPTDQMNTHAIGIEAANDGVGQEWPQVQIDAYFALNNALAAAYGLQPTDCCSHQAYAPDRKIDPATAAAVKGPWHPDPSTGSGTWDLFDIKAEAANRAGHLPPPDPGPDPGPAPQPPKDDDMQRITAATDINGTIWIGDGVKRVPLVSMEVFDNYVVLAAVGCYQFVNTGGQVIGNVGHVRQVADATIQALGAL